MTAIDTILDWYEMQAARTGNGAAYAEKARAELKALNAGPDNRALLRAFLEWCRDGVSIGNELGASEVSLCAFRHEQSKHWWADVGINHMPNLIDRFLKERSDAPVDVDT